MSTDSGRPPGPSRSPRFGSGCLATRKPRKPSPANPSSNALQKGRAPAFIVYNNHRKEAKWETNENNLNQTRFLGGQNGRTTQKKSRLTQMRIGGIYSIMQRC